jgi:hypothetical protein
VKKIVYIFISFFLLITTITACNRIPDQVKSAVEDLSPGAKIQSVQEVVDEQAVENAQDYIAPGVRTVVISGEGEIRNATAWCVVYEPETSGVNRMLVVIENKTYTGPTAEDLYDILGCTNY